MLAKMVKTALNFISAKKESDADMSVSIDTLFDKRYRNIVVRDVTPDRFLLFNWLEKNTKGSVKIEICPAKQSKNGWVIEKTAEDKIIIGFDNSNDYLMFKVNYNDTQNK